MFQKSFNHFVDYKLELELDKFLLSECPISIKHWLHAILEQRTYLISYLEPQDRFIQIVIKIFGSSGLKLLPQIPFSSEFRTWFHWSDFISNRYDSHGYKRCLREWCSNSHTHEMSMLLITDQKPHFSRLVSL